MNLNTYDSYLHKWLLSMIPNTGSNSKTTWGIIDRYASQSNVINKPPKNTYDHTTVPVLKKLQIIRESTAVVDCCKLICTGQTKKNLSIPFLWETDLRWRYVTTLFWSLHGVFININAVQNIIHVERRTGTKAVINIIRM